MAPSKETEQLALELILTDLLMDYRRLISSLTTFQFKESIQDIVRPEHDDDYLLRWLQARKFDVANAENMFRDSMDFRKKIGADTIVEKWEKPEVLKRFLPGGVCGLDKDGGPLKVEVYGHLDMKGIMYSCKRQDLEKCQVRQCEIIYKMIREQEQKTVKIVRQIRERKFGMSYNPSGHSWIAVLNLNKSIRGMTVIFDMESVSAATHLWRPGIVMYLHLVSILENNYPEMLKRLLVINAPKIFPILYRMVRPLITDDMRRKIHVFGSDYQAKLLNYIDEDNLPKAYGGKLKDENGDPRCGALIGLGGKVPEEFYLRELCVTADMESASVVKGDKMTLDFDVPKAGSILRWEFKTEENDIGFGVDFKALGSEEVKNLLPVQRVDSHIVPEDGSMECEEPGTWWDMNSPLPCPNSNDDTVVFDNTFSWTKGKKIWYTIEVVAEEDRIKGELDEIADGGDWAEIDKSAQRY